MPSNRKTAKRNKRLAREYQQFLACPVPNCGAAPHEESIDEWCVNIMVPELDNAVLHFTVSYPEEYPEQAPEIQNVTYIEHKNVYGTYICLDILTMSEETKNTPFRGWTAAYTISSLLVQLQSFLFETIESVSETDRKRMIREAKRYHCRLCGHTKSGVHPEILCKREKISEKISERSYIPTLAKDEEVFFLAETDNVIRSILFEFCDEGTLAKLRFLTVGDTEPIDLAFTSKQYKCFYTLKNFASRGVVIGLGVKTAIMDRRSRKTKKKTPRLQQLHPSFDFISHEAFEMGVRNNIWKDRDFNWFIPLYINRSHGKDALPMAERRILELWNSPELKKRHIRINGELILDVLGKMMNTTVVNMMKTVEDLEAGELQMFDSIKALEGFSSMHHLLLAFCEKYPNIAVIARKRVKRFIEDRIMRDKEITPDIGELLICVALSDYSWDEFSPSWIEESFVRNQRWILAKHPNLLELETDSSCIRLTQSLHATRTGKRLAMFQRFFITEIASPDRLNGQKNKNKILLSEYNKRLGQPPKGMAERLQSHSRKVISCDNWWNYFELVNFCPPSTFHLAAWLRNSVVISGLKQYHSESNITHFRENWITKPSETIQKNPRHCLCGNDLYELPENCQVIPGGPKPKLVKKKEIGIDICFVLDCTGSMGQWIDSAKESIQTIIKTVSKKCNSTVRFAIAGYRDHHSQGSGDDKYVVRSFDFTRDSAIAKERVAGYSADGGRDYPEAMCCAMKAASDMSWNRDGHQIVITIADAPPHGLGCFDDDYEDGCPCGADSLRIAHTMKDNGIVIYPVDCGNKDPTRQTFFHALARITGGYALDLTDAKLLSDVVVSACMQETMLDKLADNIAPLYEYSLQHLPEGRFEQHCQAVYSECVAKNVTVESALPPDNYSEYIEHQVSCIAFCMDIQQAKAMEENEYSFESIKRDTKLCSYMERPVTLQQITKCMKRMKDIIAKRRLLKEGCLYKSAERFTTDAFEVRWKTFQSERNIGMKFAPWDPITTKERKALKILPDGTNMKKTDNIGRVAQFNTPQKKRNFTADLVGKTIEICKRGSWRQVRVAQILRNGKVGIEINGKKLAIDDSTKWRHHTVGLAKTTVPAPAKTTVPAPPRNTSETHVPALEPRRIISPSRESVPEDKPTHTYKVGDSVKCRMASEKPWMNGTVTHTFPLSIRLHGESTPYLFRHVRPHQAVTKQVAAEPTKTTVPPPIWTKVTTSKTHAPTLEPRERGRFRSSSHSSLDWEHLARGRRGGRGRGSGRGGRGGRGNVTLPSRESVPKDEPTHTYKVGDWVDCRMTSDCFVPWMNGVVTHTYINSSWVGWNNTLSIQLNGSGKSYHFTHVRPHTYKVGDLVNCRMASDKPWMNGIVSHTTSPLSIQLNGSGTPYLFKQVRPHAFKVGDIVDCRMASFKPWMNGGVVSHTSPLSIQLNGSGTPYLFRYVRPSGTKFCPNPYGLDTPWTREVTFEPLQTTVPGTKVIASETHAPALEPRNVTLPSNESVPKDEPTNTYKRGDLVNCRMSLDKPWMNGSVYHISPLSIQLNGSGQPYLFNHVRPHQAVTKQVATHETNESAAPKNRTSVHAPIGTKKVINSETNAPALEPQDVTLPSREPVSEDKPTHVFPTLVISDIPDDCTAKDLATQCRLFGFLPKRVQVGKTEGGIRIALLVFEEHGHADCIRTSGLTHFGVAMKISWLEGYIKQSEHVI